MWQNAFCELMFSQVPTHAQIEQAMLLKYQNIPQRLFKYCSLDPRGYSLENLKKGQIWLSSPLEFNDPYDCCLSFAVDQVGKDLFVDRLDAILSESGLNIDRTDVLQLKKSSEVARDLARLIARRRLGAADVSEKMADFISVVVHDKINEMMVDLSNSYQQRTVVSCFSEKNDSLLMWSHYAQRHQGFCVEYDVRRWKSNYLRLLFPVIYSDTLPDLTALLFPKGWTSGGTPHSFAADLAAMTKASDWAYEQEWRFIDAHGLVGGPGGLQAPEATAIYVGTRSTTDAIDPLLEMARDLGIPVYNMAMSHNEYRLVVSQQLS